MTLTIVATAGDASANAYCTLAEAEAYVATLVWAEDWAGKTDEQKKAAIINGARLLDTLRWRGVRSSQAQAMAWPRCAGNTPVRFDGLTVAAEGYLLDRDGYEVASDTIPNQVKNANAEFALRLLGEDRSADAGGLAPDRVKLGQLEVSGLRRRMVPASVRDLVREFLEADSGFVPAVRG